MNKFENLTPGLRRIKNSAADLVARGSGRKKRFDPINAPRSQSLLQLSVRTETLFSERPMTLGEIHTYYNGPIQRPHQAGLPARTTIRAPAADLVRLPAGTRVSGPDGSLAMVGDYFVAEQIAVNEAVDLPVSAERILGGPVVDVRDDTVLVARFGDGTWGHWLMELLPKIALCERHAPGRFHYALADAVLGQGSVWRERVLESIAAYGVMEDRLTMIDQNTIYSFANLFAVTPVLTRGVMHPDVIDLMTTDVRGVKRDEPGSVKTALMRFDPLRAISNLEDVKGFLSENRFSIIKIGTQPFAEQVAIFNSSLTLFSVLGSGLSGLLYSPAGVRVIAASPDSWCDDYFHGLVQTKFGRWAEARGPVTVANLEVHRMSAFHLPLQHLEAAVASLGL